MTSGAWISGAAWTTGVWWTTGATTADLTTGTTGAWTNGAAWTTGSGCTTEVLTMLEWEVAKGTTWSPGAAAAIEAKAKRRACEVKENII